MTKILVIEDEPLIRANILEILMLSDFDAIEASDGEKGLELAKQELPDLILCDIMLPKLDGYQIVTALREHKPTANTPLIFLTARVERKDQRQGMEFGADDYLTKPFTPQELLKAIDIQLEKLSLRQSQAQTELQELRSNIALSLPHELHTPLNGILGMSQIIISDYDTIERDELLEIAEGIYQSGLRLYRLTQNFVLYADLEMISQDPARASSLLNKQSKTFVKKTISSIAEKKGQDFKRQDDLKLEIIEAEICLEEQKLSKIVEELIDNAFKFSLPHTTVLVQGVIQEKNFKLIIKNYGKGMTSEQINNLGGYRQFQRNLYEQQGSGLGLIIAKRLTELYGGKFVIESIPNQDVTVTIIFPLIAT